MPRHGVSKAINQWRHGPSGAAIMAPSLAATDMGKGVPLGEDRSAALRTSRASRRLLRILMEMNYRLHLKTVINQSDVTSDRNIAMLAGRWRKLAIEIRRRRMHFLSEILIENGTLTETRFLVS